MTHITILNVLLLFLGLVFNTFYSLQKAKNAGKLISLGYFIKDNWITMGMTVVSGFISLLLAPQLIKACGLTAASGDDSFYMAHAVVSGIIPLFFIDKLLKLFK